MDRWKNDLLDVFPAINEVWITHPHPDHRALSAALQIELGCLTLCSIQANEILEKPNTFLSREYRKASGFKGDVFPWFLRPFAGASIKYAYGS